MQLQVSDNPSDVRIPVAHRNYVYRLKMRPPQFERLEQILEQQRLLYNAALQERIDCYRKTGKGLGFYDQCKSLTRIRADDPSGYGALPANLSRGTLSILDRAMQAFFRRVKAGQSPGFPRFRSMFRWSSISFKEMSGLRLSESLCSLTFEGLGGYIRIRRHRVLPEGSKPKAAVLRKTALGWELSLLVEIPLLKARDWLPVSENPKPDIGVDMGIESFLTTSDGEQIRPLNINRRRTAETRRLQRSLARKKKGSEHRRRAIRRLAKHAARMAWARKDHAHKLSTQLVQRFRYIVVEDLQLGSMTKSAKGTTEAPGKNVQQKAVLNRLILDQGWSDFLFKLTYKAESAGGQVIRVKPHGTSQQCSGCGQIVEKTLSDRTHACPYCQLTLHRDHNAARNILFRAAREDKIPARLQLMVG